MSDDDNTSFLKSLGESLGDDSEIHDLIAAYEALASASNDVISELSIPPRVLIKVLAIQLGRFLTISATSEQVLPELVDGVAQLMTVAAGAQLLTDRAKREVDKKKVN